MDRIGKRYWSEEVEGRTLRDTLHNDNVFRHIESTTIQDLASQVLEDLDDLAVLLLFSVFEASVRERNFEEMERELETPRHIVPKKAIADAKDTVEHGSFGRLTESYKGLDPDLRTLVDQVRRYRNRVAHGRRKVVSNNVEPDPARSRLGQFLGLVDAEAAATATASLADPAIRPSDVSPTRSGNATPP
ncbi:hypothetical protein ACYOEI_28155 [Singulisphaera rosea]